MADDPSLALLGAVRAALLTDAGVMAHVGGRVYEDVPRRPVFPYLTLRESGNRPDDAQCYVADEIDIDVHVWSRHRNRTSTECRRIGAAVVAALDDADLTLPAPFALSRIVRRSRRTIRETNPHTWHGVLSFAAGVETIETET